MALAPINRYQAFFKNKKVVIFAKSTADAMAEALQKFGQGATEKKVVITLQERDAQQLQAA